MIRLSPDEVNKMVHEGYFPGAFKDGRGEVDLPDPHPGFRAQALSRESPVSRIDDVKSQTPCGPIVGITGIIRGKKQTP